MAKATATKVPANSAPAKKAPANSVPAKKAAPTKSGAAKQTTNSGSMLEEFFVDELKDIYWAEKHLLKVLPKMQKAATSTTLQQCFADHLQATQTHVERLEQAFQLMGKKAQAKKCDAMAGITEEGAGIIKETEKGTATRDVGLVLAGQKVEHYEISTYGGLAQLARTLGKEDVAQLLETTLGEEKEADSLLTQIAENDINYKASQEKEN
jgi:ferritin-like metal-binding protein YciE